jgi:hypothetical protein
MLSRTLISIAILATSAFAVALDKRAVQCETSDASPTVFEAEAAINVLIARGDQQCCQTNAGGSKCKDLSTAGGGVGLFFLLDICASGLIDMPL